jgi:hypothetical protein
MHAKKGRAGGHPRLFSSHLHPPRSRTDHSSEPELAVLTRRLLAEEKSP